MITLYGLNNIATLDEERIFLNHVQNSKRPCHLVAQLVPIFDAIVFVKVYNLIGAHLTRAPNTLVKILLLPRLDFLERRCDLTNGNFQVFLEILLDVSLGFLLAYWKI